MLLWSQVQQESKTWLSRCCCHSETSWTLNLTRECAWWRFAVSRNFSWTSSFLRKPISWTGSLLICPHHLVKWECTLRPGKRFLLPGSNFNQMCESKRTDALHISRSGSRLFFPFTLLRYMFILSFCSGEQWRSFGIWKIYSRFRLVCQNAPAKRLIELLSDVTKQLMMPAMLWVHVEGREQLFKHKNFWPARTERDPHPDRALYHSKCLAGLFLPQISRQAAWDTTEILSTPRWTGLAPQKFKKPLLCFSLSPEVSLSFSCGGCKLQGNETCH